MWPQTRKREIDVYDRRLEAISAAAELGSFSRAAAKLRMSTPALVKQVSGFEAEFGITLFERSHSGVKVTPAGALLVDDAPLDHAASPRMPCAVPGVRRAMAVRCAWACR